MAKEAIVIDVAMRAAEVSPGERCTHVGVSGVRCQRRRQDKDGYCRLHGVYESTMMATLGVPLPEDAVSLQLFLTRVLEFVMSGRVRPNQVTSVMQLCKMISQNTREYEWQQGRQLGDSSLRLG